MVNPVPITVQKTWEECNVQVFVLLSFFLQTLLTLLAPFRKRTTSLTVTAIIWLAYLLADWVASFAIGLIASTTREDLNHSNGDLFAFWASFLLLHLGGPDTITALSLEDNALWLRQLLALVFQVFGAAYILILSLPSNSLLVPSLIVFNVGIIKYAERIRALYLVISNMILQKCARTRRDGRRLPVRKEEVTSQYTTLATDFEDHDPALVIYARNYHEKQRSAPQSNYTGHSEKEFKDAIRDLLAGNPGRLMEVNSIRLNWFYLSSYTKAAVIGSTWGFTFRLVSLSALVAALLLFYLTDKRNFEGVNTVITYVLLCGAVFLDTLSLLVLIPADGLYSELYIKRYRLGQYQWVIRFVHYYLKLRRPNWTRSSTRCSISSLIDWGRQIFFRRWCESVSGYNLVEYSLREIKGHERGHTFSSVLGNICIRAVNLLGLEEVRDRLKYVSREPLSKELWDFIVNKAVDNEDRNFTLDNDSVYQRLYPNDDIDHKKRSYG